MLTLFHVATYPVRNSFKAQIVIVFYFLIIFLRGYVLLYLKIQHLWITNKEKDKGEKCNLNFIMSN